MEIKSKNYIWLFFAILISLMSAAYFLNIYYQPPAPKIKGARAQANDNSPGASYVTVRDENGKVVLQTGIEISPDDEYISEDNTHYVITRVEGSEAVARPKQPPAQAPAIKNTAGKSFSVPVVASNKPRHVVLYTTHTDESFIPTSGTESKPGDGDVYRVAASLGEALSKSGVSVSQSLNQHDPHDINAYSRSRRSLVQLLLQQPDAAFDVHRDSAPGEAYVTSINGINTSRVMIVVGASNPAMETNLRFAAQIKDAADSLYPGLMRGIFIGRGDYNQDLYPTSLLFEIGSQSLALDDAQKAAHCLADAVLTVLNSNY